MKKTEKNKIKVLTNKVPLSFEDKQLAAYYEWQKRGAPLDDDFTDWDLVERRWEDDDQSSIDMIEQESL